MKKLLWFISLLFSSSVVAEVTECPISARENIFCGNNVLGFLVEQTPTTCDYLVEQTGPCYGKYFTKPRTISPPPEQNCPTGWTLEGNECVHRIAPTVVDNRVYNWSCSGNPETNTETRLAGQPKDCCTGPNCN